MKLFISWSGARSERVASFLRDWIPDVMNAVEPTNAVEPIGAVEPWMSQRDLSAGGRWNNELEDELSRTQFGIICLTRTNLKAPWILFEAGALAKTLADTFVCPYLIGVEPAQVPQGPLSRFHSKSANDKGTWDLIRSINGALGKDARTDEQLRRTFDRWWPVLKAELDSLPVEEKDELSDDERLETFSDLGMDMVHKKLTHGDLQHRLERSEKIRVHKTWFPESNVIEKGLRLAITVQHADVKLLLCKPDSVLLEQRSKGAAKPSNRGSSAVYDAVKKIRKWIEAVPDAKVEIACYDSWPGCPVIWYDDKILMGFYFRRDASPEWPWVSVKAKSYLAEILDDQFWDLWNKRKTEHLKTPEQMSDWLERNKKFGRASAKVHRTGKNKKRR